MINLESTSQEPKTVFSFEENVEKFSKIDRKSGDIIFGYQENAKTLEGKILYTAKYNHEKMTYSEPIEIQAPLFSKNTDLLRYDCFKGTGTSEIEKSYLIGYDNESTLGFLWELKDRSLRCIANFSVLQNGSELMFAKYLP